MFGFLLEFSDPSNCRKATAMQFGQGLRRPKKAKATAAAVSAEPRPEDMPNTTALRRQQWKGVDSASGISLDAGTVVRVVSHHAIDERRSEWLDGVAPLDRRSFVFCALHAHMRLTEALLKDMFGRAIDSRRVQRLKDACKEHLGLENKFVRSDKTKGWNKVSLFGYECWRFAEEDELGVSNAEKVIRDVWPNGTEIAKGGKSQGSSLRDSEFVESYCGLWKVFNSVMRQTRCKDPNDAELSQYGANCRDLGARWNLLLPSNRCSTFYLHTLVHHGGDFMEYCLKRNLTIGMLENSGAERRHEIGRVQFKKALSGGGKAYRGTREFENRSAYLTLRGLLIWQYGRDKLAEMESLFRAQIIERQAKPASRTRTADGWANAERRDTLRALWAERDEHDDILKMDSVLSEEALQRLDKAKEGDGPQCVLSEQGRQELATIDPEAPLIVDDGTVAGGLDPWHEDDADSCISGYTGSSCRSEWVIEHDDLSDWDSESEEPTPDADS
jgi:hypothetical protein